MDNNDIEVDDLFGGDENPKKKVNGKRKGNRVELELCKKLSEHFGDTFSRAVGSGNRWGQVSFMPTHAKKTLVGDICVPEGFKWVIECKGGYDDDVDFSSAFEGCTRIDEFIKQSKKDAELSERMPIVFWKRSRKPWIAMLRGCDFTLPGLGCYLKYNDWIVLSLDNLLENTTKDYWYDTGSSK